MWHKPLETAKVVIEPKVPLVFFVSESRNDCPCLVATTTICATINVYGVCMEMHWPCFYRVDFQTV